jgi:hypothetical protein
MSQEHKDCRQGSVLTKESSVALGLIDSQAPDEYCVVISHDCDIYNLAETRVECIVATSPSNINAAFSHTAHPRKLNVTYTLEDSQIITLELTHADRKDIPKEQFLQEGKIAKNFHLSMQEKRVLKTWLAARYGRPAFPNEFEARLRIDKDFERKIRRILQPVQAHLIGIFFLLGRDRFDDLPVGSPYCLTITVAYDGMGGTVAREAAESCAKQLKELFHKTYGTPDMAENIALEDCTAISDMHFSLADIRKADQWRVDSISLKEEPHGELLSAALAPA